ncbi:hypothetical protein A3I27_01645 [Candidatus Giovannonibacteria bacterium RIFCSPLOWO2_02_FULL_43_11b]|uniref:EamA domain-containing protein n=1 Tax=Candidatus Giovannonibacteria bacterium RIFCSPHIGHO2_12_FULL_43_15 TaxID=1798341 RepID=A0A1F5WP68_9BACT|nr:MAG: hypothetical protein A2739_01120 [Candidatus Giovannonibacteria bacterium RIFCSPHIGHO2_01_FULL_43_100]OGF66459.1 MAG: hypothetical protein A3B97_03920 [Candidatus Giovannonibacteria bacterium RIFCSPHIGHO2_02_FULL_43_32]OGF77404.1 MAG: hypothetical protein A3F23_03705 [Candidatus Giovannonibacteria bacterium RIFCSPHIGHO2_12_FULL_43_15]OGF78430.1 MAG: hypothetical protein A3A15_03495 [Candidatus Giovannonibacteria bacterium RIFCSPLOWO2_01_FULL_43_60]OGF89789.1 MAG: hypothetical protein A3
MSWISFAVFGYFLQAVSVLGDKIILKKILPSPSSYAFWQGILSLGAVILIPFGFSLIPTDKIFISFLAGAFWLYGLFFFFTALRKADASNVLPVVLSITAILLFIMEGFFMGHQFSPTDLLAGVFMVSGSVSLSLEHRWGHRRKIRGFIIPAVVTAFLFAFSTFLMKYLFGTESFFNVFVWSRGGLFLAGLTLMLSPEYKKEIFQGSKSLRNQRASVSIVINKIFGASGALFVFFALSRGPATLVNALQGLQYAFLFIIGAFLSLWIPTLHKESLSPKAIMQKVFGIVFISFGLFILYFYGN